MNKKKKIDYFGIILVILLIFVSICFAQIKIFHKQYLNIFGYSIFTVITGSMEPTIQVNDVVLVKITQDVNVNDIITYITEDNNFVTHRAKIINDDGTIIARGDSNNSDDSPINKTDLVGRVCFIFTTSVWLQVIKSPQVIIASITTIIIIWYLFSYKNNDNKNFKEIKKD